MVSKMREIHKKKGQNGYDDRFSSGMALEMLDATKTEVETPGDGDGELASVLLDEIADIIRAYGGVVDRLGNSLTFHAGSGRTYVEVKGIHTRTIDKREVENVVLIRTELPNYRTENREMVIMNTLASLGALVHERNSERVSIVSQCSEGMSVLGHSMFGSLRAVPYFMP